MIISEGSYGIFLQSGISIALVVMTVFSLLYPYLSVLWGKLKQRKAAFPEQE
jgi:TctA family transporter